MSIPQPIRSFEQVKALKESEALTETKPEETLQAQVELPIPSLNNQQAAVQDSSLSGWLLIAPVLIALLLIFLIKKHYFLKDSKGNREDGKA